MNPSGFLGGPYPVLVFGTPIAVLTAALVFKLPSIVRLWRDPLRRAVGGLLLLACGIFVFAAPPAVAWTNRVTGVPNFAAPLVYSFLVAFCGASLLLVIAWRGGLTGRSERSARARRAMRWVTVGHVGVIVALWTLFGLADVSVERRRDLDTYYARTPFVRELIALYLLAHTTSCVMTYRLIRDWIHTAGLDVWLRRGLKSLAVGYAVNLVFDAAKATAVVARWTGRDLDPLSTELAPAAAGSGAVLIATGFVLPHAGQYLRDRWQLRRAHLRLGPLYDLLRTATGRGVPYSLRATPELRLTRRETFIRDALLQLSRHFDEELRRRAYEAALVLGYGPGRAGALAAAVTIQEAIETRTVSQPLSPSSHASRSPHTSPSSRSPDSPHSSHSFPSPPSPSPSPSPSRSCSPSPSCPQVPDRATDLLTDLLQGIEAVSQVLSHPDEIEAVRARATAPAESLHVYE